MSYYATDPQPMPDLSTEDVYGPVPDTEAEDLIAADISNDLSESNPITDEDICQECGGLDCWNCPGCGEASCTPGPYCKCDRDDRSDR